MEKIVGVHLVVDAWKCPPELLDDPEKIRQTLINAVQIGRATLIDLCVHQFSPHGITATATLAESHIAIHTWPEYGYFAADLFFCGDGDPHLAMDYITSTLQAGEVRMKKMNRGLNVSMNEGELINASIAGT
jgi:S-adenosylmethionine decarboxylase